jgi:hypothetical protein
MQSKIPQIPIASIEKVFLADEVGTHALSVASLEKRHDDFVSSEVLA